MFAEMISIHNIQDFIDKGRSNSWNTATFRMLTRLMVLFRIEQEASKDYLSKIARIKTVVQDHGSINQEQLKKVLDGE